MKNILILSLFLLSFELKAWYCLEVASERIGDIINACGIAESTDEDTARKIALNNAYKELDLICSHSSDCAEKALDITPLRTDCKKIDSIYRCHRGITASIIQRPRDIGQKQLLQEIFIPKKIIQQDGSKDFVKSSIVDFNSTPQGAHVHIDGVEICQTPCTKEIDQGEHKITFEKEDFDLFTEIKQIGQGRQSLNPTLQLHFGYLTIIGLPEDAVVKVDNLEVAAKDKIRLSANEHVVTVTSKHFQPWYQKFEIKKGELKEFPYNAEALLGHVKISVSDNKGYPLEASIEINGVTQSTKTPTALAMNSGKNIVILKHAGFKDLRFEVNLSVNEKLEIKKEMISNNFKAWQIYIGFGLSSGTVSGLQKDSNYSCCYILDLSIQKTLSDHLSLKLTYNYLGKMNSSEYSSNYYSGTPNSTAYFTNDFDGHLLGIALPIYLNREEHSSLYFGPEIGTLFSKFKISKYQFSSMGYGSLAGDQFLLNFDQKYQGIFLGAEWLKPIDQKNSKNGLYVQTGLRNFFDAKNLKSNYSHPQTNLPSKKSAVFYAFIGGELAY